MQPACAVDPKEFDQRRSRAAEFLGIIQQFPERAVAGLEGEIGCKNANSLIDEVEIVPDLFTMGR